MVRKLTSCSLSTAPRIFPAAVARRSAPTSAEAASTVAPAPTTVVKARTTVAAPRTAAHHTTRWPAPELISPPTAHAAVTAASATAPQPLYGDNDAST